MIDTSFSPIRIWSKKYPIRIRTNQRKPPTDLDTSSKIEEPSSSTDCDPAASTKKRQGSFKKKDKIDGSPAHKLEEGEDEV